MVNKIGINLLFVNPKLAGGSVTYAVKLLKELSIIDKQNEYLIYINRDCEFMNFEVGQNFKVKVLNFSYSSVYLRYLWEQFILPIHVYRDKIDLLHSLGYVSPLLAPTKKIVSILDINYIGHSSNMSMLKRILLGTMVNLSAKFSKKIITISEFSKDEIAKYTNTHRSKIIVTLLSGSNDFLDVPTLITSTLVLSKYNINFDYIIAFSSPSPHKNIARLIEGLKTILDKEENLKLLLVGHTNKSQNIVDIIKENNLINKVLFTGFVLDEDIMPLIARSTYFVFPSLYEGFGIPLLDAQACGVVVLSSNAGSLPEVGGSSVFYFDPCDPIAIAEAFEKVIGSDLESKIKEGLGNRKLYSWNTTAKRTLEVYNEFLS